MSKRDCYEILGVRRDAKPDEIKREYRKLAKKHHPDRNPNDPSAEVRFKEVQEAYNVLGDEEKRRQYDEYGTAGVGQWSTGTGGQRVYQWGGGSSVSAEDLEDLFAASGFGGGGGASVFEQFLGGDRQAGFASRRGRSRRQPQKGADLEHTVHLTFEQAIFGSVVPLRVPGSNDSNGQETIEVKVPPGIEDRQKIRVAGKGRPGVQGGPPGHLYLICRVAVHAYFSRRGADLYLEVPITVVEAALGAKIEVPSLDGPTTVTIPPGTGGGSKLRLKGKGVQRRSGDGRGDQYLTIIVKVPKELSEEERLLYEQLRDTADENPRSGCGWATVPKQ